MLPRFLWLLAVSLAGFDIVWALAGHFTVNWASFARLFLLSLLLFAGAAFYTRVRADARLAAMLFGTGFLTLFSAAASVLNYLLLSVAGPRIDTKLAMLDRSIGFDWPSVMHWAALHPGINMILLLVYSFMLPQVAILSIALASGIDPRQVYNFTLAIALGALICIGVWALAPSFGAFSVYDFDTRMPLALDRGYAAGLVRLLVGGPGVISPANAKGLIGFPSYHAVMALLVIRFAWPLRWLRWPALALNLLVLIATPIQGGHHLVDVLAAFPVAAIAFAISAKRSMRPLGLVNYAPKLTVALSANALFRIVAAHMRPHGKLGS